MILAATEFVAVLGGVGLVVLKIGREIRIAVITSYKIQPVSPGRMAGRLQGVFTN
jgi:hypothetical protein